MKFNSKKVLLSSFAASLALSFTACGSGSSSTTSSSNPPAASVSLYTGDSVTGIQEKFEAQTAKTKEDVSGTITSNTTWTADKVYRLSGKVLVSGATLTIEAGTTVIGAAGTGANASWLAIDKDAKIIAEGTADKHIVFTSEIAYDGGKAEVGQWGSLVIIGTAANPQVGPYEVDNSLVADSSNMTGNSGVLKYVDILNSGITIEEDKELNGLSLVGVGSGTTIENILVDKSDDDCIEAWGGTVNMTNITVSECTDDHFDIDDGYAGTVTNLRIKQIGGNAGIEMSGQTAATFNNLYIDVLDSKKEGAIYFKKDGIGGHFNNVMINYPSTITNGYAAIHSAGTFDSNNTSFTNVVIADSNATRFSGDSATGIEAKYNAQTITVTGKQDVSGTISTDTTWTADTVWRLNGKVLVTNGAKLTIEPGTVVIGKAGTGANASWLAIDANASIDANGTADKHIVFTSETAFDGNDAAYGQWGSLVLVGNAAMDTQVAPYEVDTSLIPGSGVANDNSGVLNYVDILNSGITIEEDKELNGLSLVGVGSGTTISNIIVDKSDDDCIEAWGGTVNMTNVSVSECTDDQFDIDDGYAGTVTNLQIKQMTGNAGMEMSGETAATFASLYIDVVDSKKEGAIYFKKDGIGGHFNDAIINYSIANGYGLFHSAGAFDSNNTSFSNVRVAY